MAIDLDAMGDDESIVIGEGRKAKAKPATQEEQAQAETDRYWGRLKTPEVDRRRRELGLLAQHSSQSCEHYTSAEVMARVRSALGGRIELDPASCDLANQVVQAERYYGLTWREDPSGSTVRKVAASLAADGSLAWETKRYTPHRTDGLVQPWEADTVFLNPPGGLTEDMAPQYCGISRSYPIVWWGKLVASYLQGRVKEAVFLAFTLELLSRTQTLANLPHAFRFPICYPVKRLAFDYPDDTELGVPLPGTDRNPSAAPPHANALVYLGPNVERFAEAMSPIGAVVVPR